MKLAASQLKSLQDLDASAQDVRAQLEVSREREAGVTREQTVGRRLFFAKAVTFLEAALLNQAFSSIGRDVEEVRSLLAIEKHAWRRRTEMRRLQSWR